MNTVVKFFGLGLLAMIGLILIVCESEQVEILLVTKMIGVGLWVLVAKLYKQLEIEHKFCQK